MCIWLPFAPHDASSARWRRVSRPAGPPIEPRSRVPPGYASTPVRRKLSCLKPGQPPAPTRRRPDLGLGPAPTCPARGRCILTTQATRCAAPRSSRFRRSHRSATPTSGSGCTHVPSSLAPGLVLPEHTAGSNVHLTATADKHVVRAPVLGRRAPAEIWRDRSGMACLRFASPGVPARSSRMGCPARIGRRSAGRGESQHAFEPLVRSVGRTFLSQTGSHDRDARRRAGTRDQPAKRMTRQEDLRAASHFF